MSYGEQLLISEKTKLTSLEQYRLNMQKSSLNMINKI